MTENTNQNGKSVSTPQTQLTNSRTPTTSSNGKKRNRHRHKKNKNAAAPRVQLAPVKEYVSLCHGALTKKPRTGTATSVNKPGGGRKQQSDPTQVKGLGGWRCEECGKPCKVKAQTPTATEVISAV